MYKVTTPNKKHLLSQLVRYFSQNSQSSSRLLIGSSAALIMGLSPTPAFAEEGESELKLEEVVVTARRRDESLTDVPVSVSAYSGDHLVDIGAADVTALSQSSPNTTLRVGRATNSTLAAFIRGVGQQDPLVGFEPGVGIYLDDVYLARPMAAVMDVYDVERIEVLRGPQGTLYGRNTIGGAVKYVTKKLGDDPFLKIKGSVGSYNQTDLIVTGGAPITGVDGLRAGGSVAVFKRDGFGENLVTGEDNYNKDVAAARASLEWDVSDSFSLRFAADYSDDDSLSKGGHRQTNGNTSGVEPLDNIFDTRAGATQQPSTAGIDGNQEVVAEGAMVSANWEISDSLTFTSTTAYREDYTESVVDLDSLEAMDFDLQIIYDNQQFSQEFKLGYSSDRMHGVFGFYYLDANAKNDFDAILNVAGVGNVGAFSPLTVYTGGDVDTDTWSLFGDLTYDFTEQLSGSAGLRYTTDKRTALVQRLVYAGIGSAAFGTSNPLIATNANFEAEKTFNNVSPKIGISWKPKEDMNIYASYSRGFKAGGFDPRSNTNQNPNAVNGYDPEVIDATEVGIKTKLADDRIALNLAYFYNDYTDMQIPGSVPYDSDGDGINDDFAGSVTNAGKAVLSGFEIESTLLATENLSFTLAAGYIDADLKEFVLNGANIASQRVIQFTPDWTGNFSTNYSTELSMGGELSVIGTLSYKGLTYNFETPDPLVDQEAYTLFDMSIVWNSDDDKYFIGLHGKNLTDEEYKVAGFNLPALGQEGSVVSYYGAPMTVTLTGEVRF